MAASLLCILRYSTALFALAGGAQAVACSPPPQPPISVSANETADQFLLRISPVASTYGLNTIFPYQECLQNENSQDVEGITRKVKVVNDAFYNKIREIHRALQTGELKGPLTINEGNSISSVKADFRKRQVSAGSRTITTAQNQEVMRIFGTDSCPAKKTCIRVPARDRYRMPPLAAREADPARKTPSGGHAVDPTKECLSVYTIEDEYYLRNQCASEMVVQHCDVATYTHPSEDCSSGGVHTTRVPAHGSAGTGRDKDHNDGSPVAIIIQACKIGASQACRPDVIKRWREMGSPMNPAAVRAFGQ